MNVLLISVDTLRPDHLSAYGYARDTSPALAALGAEGVVFEAAHSTSNWTLPSHMSLMTGLPPSLHGVEGDRDRLASSHQVLAEAFASAGFATAAFTSHVYLRARYGFGRGFDVYGLEPGRRAGRVTDAALGWLSGAPEPFFLFLHYFDPHWAYDAPEPFLDRFGARDPAWGMPSRLFPYLGRGLPEEGRREAVALYDGEIAYTDHEIGRLFRWLRERGRLDDTLVVVTSDHGEEFGEHGGFGHGTHLHDEVTAVPLLLRHPSVGAGERRSDVVSLLDLPATILGVAGLPVPAQYLRYGVDLRAPGAPGRRIFAESARWGPKRFAVIAPGATLTSASRYRPLTASEVAGRRRVERGETVQLPATLEGPAASPALRQDLEAALLAYGRGAVVGLRLACAREAGTTLRGLLRLSHVPPGEPFSLRSNATAEAEPGVPGGFAIRLASDAGGAELIVPLRPDAPGVLALRLEGPAGLVFDGEREIPAAGRSEPLAAGAARHCTLTGPDATPVDKDALTLEGEDLERLRALGYVE